jgi:hypothetical protein
MSAPSVSDWTQRVVRQDRAVKHRTNELWQSVLVIGQHRHTCWHASQVPFSLDTLDTAFGLAEPHGATSIGADHPRREREREQERVSKPSTGDTLPVVPRSSISDALNSINDVLV